ncbi:recombination protein NinB [Pandoraea sp. XJJ-1]|uniref:recombination protein NinB n=1 Tax=Pandoraea sp. XJJ-1 TaxID=3002643 RepID=UPI0022817741|nr:recombination protein NinB [Pandoraea sp. XJJ-1]WAL81335.1 recombination protein NinB [Pandoraea sp. XJJ-1]
MAALYREFCVDRRGVLPSIVAFVKANALACFERGEPIRLIVTSDEKKRNSQQNRKLHAMLQEIADNAWWNGRQYPMEFWKEYYRRRFLLKDEYVIDGGEIIQVYWSTADMSVGHFAELIQRIEVEAARDFGIDWNL